jgi:hypothetical protein
LCTFALGGTWLYSSPVLRRVMRVRPAGQRKAAHAACRQHRVQNNYRALNWRIGGIFSTQSTALTAAGLWASWPVRDPYLARSRKAKALWTQFTAAY